MITNVIKTIWIIAVILICISFCNKGYGADDFYGIRIFAGEQMKNAPVAHVSERYDWEEFQVKPLYGKHMDDQWDLWIEGLIGLVNYNEGQSIKLGTLIMTSYDVVKVGETKVYTEVGVGVGWCNYSPSTNTLRPNLLGFIDAGAGIKYPIKKGWLAKIGLRFHHTSSMFGHDTGINTYGLEFSLVK